MITAFPTVFITVTQTPTRVSALCYWMLTRSWAPGGAGSVRLVCASHAAWPPAWTQMLTARSLSGRIKALLESSGAWSQPRSVVVWGLHVWGEAQQRKLRKRGKACRGPSSHVVRTDLSLLVVCGFRLKAGDLEKIKMPRNAYLCVGPTPRLPPSILLSARLWLH